MILGRVSLKAVSQHHILLLIDTLQNLSLRKTTMFNNMMHYIWVKALGSITLDNQ